MDKQSIKYMVINEKIPTKEIRPLSIIAAEFSLNVANGKTNISNFRVYHLLKTD